MTDDPLGSFPTAAPSSTAPISTVPASVLDTVVSAATFGPVSAYVYDLQAAVVRAERLRAALPAWAEIFYAVKANTFPPVLRSLAPVVDGFEVASAREAELAAESARSVNSPVRLIASGPGKDEAMLSALLDRGVEILNVESTLELQRIARLAQRRGVRARVTLRVSPSPVQLTSTLAIGETTTVFGIAEAQIPAALTMATALADVDVVGFHFHVMCNNRDAAAHARFVQWCVDWSSRTAADHGVDLHIVDVGGGLGVPAGADDELDLECLADHLAQVDVRPGVRIIFEPGRWIVDDCGYYVSTVTDLKQTNGTWFAVLRGGINHYLRPAAYGTPDRMVVVPMSDWPYDFARPEARDARVTIAGELCTPADVLARDVRIDAIRPGDVVVFLRVGSYGWEMSVKDFLGHAHADRMVAVPSDADHASRE
jgi:diaminopimelate decarboxylase